MESMTAQFINLRTGEVTTRPVCPECGGPPVVEGGRPFHEEGCGQRPKPATDPIEDLRRAYAQVSLHASDKEPNTIIISSRVYRGIVQGIGRGARRARSILRRPLPARHRPGYARAAARQARAQEYLATSTAPTNTPPRSTTAPRPRTR